MKGTKQRQRIMRLLEVYEDNDNFAERAHYLENSRLSIRDELIV
jgi:hypothetical protein